MRPAETPRQCATRVMQPRLALAVATSIAACLAAGCGRDASPPLEAGEDRRGDAAAPPVASADDQGPAVTMRYACDGQRVAVFGQDHASVTLADGREVELAYAAGSSPPRFSGEALEFSVAADGAVLAQDEGTTWACTAE